MKKTSEKIFFKNQYQQKEFNISQGLYISITNLITIFPEKYLKMFEENNKVYVYLLDDDEITLDKLNYSLLSSKVSEWIPYGFVFYYSKI